METKCQYLFVVTPPEELANEIHQIRIEFAEKYQCKAALKPPVHITLLINYWALPRTENKLLWLHDWAATLKPFEVRLKNFGTFPGNGVVFIDVEPNEELQSLHRGLAVIKQMLPSGTIRSAGTLNPHITIGYRDIPKEKYEAAAAEYLGRDFQAAFMVDKFCLWKHNGQKWETLHSYKMEAAPLSHSGELFH